MKVLAFLASVLVFVTSPDIARADGIELSGSITAEVRAFQHSAAHTGQHEERLAPSLSVQPEWRYDLGADDRLTVIPFVRWDAWDSQRSHFDMREFNWLHVGDGWDLRLGIDKVFWGVAESRHLVDIVNQTDLVEDIDGEDKLGQPMLNLGLQHEWGDLNLFIMPGFRERTFAGPKGRLRGEPPVDTDRAVYVGGASRGHVDLALRYSVVAGDWDIGLSHFHGVGREPRMVLSTNANGDAVYVPHYDLIDQSGLDLQATKGDWLWKFEAIVRSGQGDIFAAAVGGFEYTIYNIVESGADLGLLAEYLYDGRDATVPATALDDDLFIGLRLGLNDPDDSSVLAGVVVDRNSRAYSLTLEGETRLADSWKLGVEAMATGNLPATDPGYGLRRDNHLLIRLVRYF
jgi:hypothetical protein